MENGRLFAIAGNRAEFDYWCREHDISLRNRNLVYVAEEWHVHGIHGGIFLLIGTAQERRDARHLALQLLHRSATEATAVELDEWIAANRHTQPA